MDEDSMERGDERDDERELWERCQKAQAELKRIRQELEGPVYRKPETQEA